MPTKLPMMHLTDDDVHDLLLATGPIMVRIRIWREAGGRPMVLVEPADDPPRPVRPAACKLATFITNCLVKGQDIVYLEHDVNDAWSVVTFLWLRHVASDPYRRTITKADMEGALCTLIPD